MLAAIYNRITRKKGPKDTLLKRIWLQGRKLARAGFEPGLRYSVTFNTTEKEIVISIDKQGDRVISKKSYQDDVLPVIDIASNRDLDEYGDFGTQLRSTVYHGRIVITLSGVEDDKIERLERLRNKLKNNEPLVIGSTSTGLGVLDHAIHEGLSLSGINSYLGYGIEINDKYIEAGLKNNPIWSSKSRAICAGMQDVTEKDLTKCEIIAAGIPCEAASRAGRSKNKNHLAEEHDTAGHLFFHFLNIVRWSNPAIVILENVPEYESTVGFTVIRKVLSEWGYNLSQRVLNGPDFGSLEARQRFVLVAATEGLEIDIDNIPALRDKEPCLDAVVDPIENDSPIWKAYPYLLSKQERDIKAGKGFRMNIMTGDEELIKTIPKNYNKVQSTNPLIQHPENPGLLRLLTKEEHCRVKTIPEFLASGLSPTVAHELLGQSVIHAAFAALGKFIGKVIKARDQPKIDDQKLSIPLTNTKCSQLPLI